MFSPFETNLYFCIKPSQATIVLRSQRLFRVPISKLWELNEGICSAWYNALTFKTLID